jgi:predicted  nucleic acid-binding Zn-ribbon protein
MSGSGDDWRADEDASGPEPEREDAPDDPFEDVFDDDEGFDQPRDDRDGDRYGEPAPRRRAGLNFMSWVLGLAGAAWLAFFAMFVARAIGWSLVPQLLPYEVGSLVAGLLVPPGFLFALAVLAARRRRLNDTLAGLEEQIARLESPFSNANSELTELGEMLVLYGQALQEAVADARRQMSELRGGFAREASELAQITEALANMMISANESAGTQAGVLADMTKQIEGNLQKISGVGKGEAEVIDAASRRAEEVVQQLLSALHEQIAAIESGFEKAVNETVGRVSGTGDTAVEEIRAVANQLAERAREAVDTVTQQADEAGTAIGDAGA